VRISRTVVGVAATASLLATLMSGSAVADTNTASATALGTVGSDTTDDVIEGLSALAALSADIANYKTVAIGRDIDTSANYPGPAGRPATADCATSAPRGSTEGKNGLRASMQGEPYVPLDPVAPVNPGSTDYSACVGVARSSSSGFPAGTAAGTMARIPFAIDAVAPSLLKGSTLPKKLSFTLLKDVYSRNGVAGSIACLNATPLIPAFSSGTRAFWASALGITDYDFSGTGGAVQNPPVTQTWGSCVTGGAANPLGVGAGAGNGNPGDRKGGAAGAPIQEHQGAFLDGANQVLPYSVGQWSVQGSQVVTDLRGTSVLGSVDFTSVTNAVVDANLRHPFSLNGQGATSVGFRGATGNLTRQVFNFVPRTLVDPAFVPPAQQTQFLPATVAADVPRFQQAFIGATSDVCANGATVLLYGFATDPACGTATFGP
jgi:hypothetical protein